MKGDGKSIPKMLYYVVETHLDETKSWNGLRTTPVYSIENSIPKIFTELVSATDGNGHYFYSNEEEIQNYLDDNGYGDEEYEFIQL